jgi:hypothetical protein
VYGQPVVPGLAAVNSDVGALLGVRWADADEVGILNAVAREKLINQQGAGTDRPHLHRTRHRRAREDRRPRSFDVVAGREADGVQKFQTSWTELLDSVSKAVQARR